MYPIAPRTCREHLFPRPFSGLREIGDASKSNLRVFENGDEISIEESNKKAAEFSARIVRGSTREIRVGEIMSMKVVKLKRTLVLAKGMNGCVSGILNI